MSKLNISCMSYDNLVVYRGRGFKHHYIKASTLEKILSAITWRTVKRKGREQRDHLEPV